MLGNLEAHGRDATPLAAGTSPRERALIIYALKLTATPAEMSREDIEAMRAAGLDDGEILDANQVTAYFAYANRVVDGLGVELESWHREATAVEPTPEGRAG
jgi:uncharacterized peroxidase-related enzyme